MEVKVVEPSENLIVESGRQLAILALFAAVIGIATVIEIFWVITVSVIQVGLYLFRKLFGH